MRFLTICFGLLIIGSQQVKASGFAIFETSVRVSGMMGAYVADGRDVSTIFFNPAGLAQLSGFNFSAGGVLIAPRTKFRGPLPTSVDETLMEAREFVIPHMYASYQIMDGLTFGLGVYVPFGLGSKWDDNWVGAGYATETRIQTAIVNPSIGYKLPFEDFGQIYVGAGLQIGVMGNALLKRSVVDFPRNAQGNYGTILLEGESEGTYYGYNFGIIYRPSKMISLGFAYRSEMEINFLGDATFTDLPASGFPPNTQGSLTITTPANWSAGISVTPMDNLTMNLDYVWWGWSSYDVLAIDFNNETAVLTDITSPRNYEDSYQIRFGAEYIVSQIEGLVLRGGIGFDKNPVPETTIDPSLPDTDRLLSSLGATYNITSSIKIDLYYTFIRGAERKVDLESNPFKGYYNTKANIIGTGITMAF